MKSTVLQYLPEQNRSPIGRRLSAKEEETIQGLLQGQKINREAFFEVMNASEREEIMKAVEAGLNTLGMQDRDRLIEQTSHLYHSDTLENVYDLERMKIVATMANVALDKRRFATITELSQLTGFSRKRINAVLKRISETDLKLPANHAMREAMLAKIFTYGLSGNVKAARLFMELTDPNPTVNRTLRIQNQNNLVQMNGIVITEDQMKALPRELTIKLQEVITAINPATTVSIPLKS